jgi:hypothetical protein
MHLIVQLTINPHCIYMNLELDPLESVVYSKTSNKECILPIYMCKQKEINILVSSRQYVLDTFLSHIWLSSDLKSTCKYFGHQRILFLSKERSLSKSLHKLG